MSEQKTHPNSKIVTIRRAQNFIQKAQGGAVKEFFTSAIQGIGSYFESKTSIKVGSGLSVTEEKILLPELLGVDRTDKTYIELRNKFYSNFQTLVSDKGEQLEVGLTLDNNGPIYEDLNDPSNSNLPINLEQYLRYRHALKHPWVAPSEEAAKGNQLVHFYVDDPITSTSTQSKSMEEKDGAMIQYLEIKNNPDKVNMMLTLLGEDYRDIQGQTDAQTVQLRTQALRTFVDKSPEKVVAVGKDKNFEVKYDIQMMVNTEVLRKVGSRYFNAETDEAIGNYEETIEFFKNVKDNSQTIAVLKTRLQEGLKAKKKAKRTKDVIGK